jgi:glycosyltransferase involved in cell wall biosynthesis
VTRLPRVRVVVLSRWYPSAADPVAGVFVADQVQALRKECDVQVLVPTAGGFAAAARFMPGRGGLDPIQRVPTPTGSLGFPLRLAAYARALSRLGARKDEPVVVHVHLLLPDALPMLVAARFHRIPVIVTEHVTFLAELVRSRRGRIQARLALRLADAVVAVGAGLAQELRELEPRARIRVIPNAVDTTVFAPSTSPSRDFALNVATRPGHDKGTDVLLRAWAAADGTLPPLVIVGDGPERPRYEQLASELGIVPPRFVGHLDRGALVEMLQNASFVVSSSRVESFGLAAIEALACGTPVVATRTGEAARAVAPGLGLLVEPDDVEGMALAVSELARTFRSYDPVLLHEAMRARYGEEVVRDKLVGLYREVTAEALP